MPKIMPKPMTIRTQEHSQTLLAERGFAYADGFFSTMGVCRGQILWGKYHHQRLLTHVAALSFNLDVSMLMQQLAEQAADLGDGIIKVVVSREPQPVRGYGWVNGDSVVDIMATKTPILPHAEYVKPLGFEDLPRQTTGDAMCLSQQIACLPKPLVGLKSLNRLDSVLVAGELERHKQTQPTLVEGLVQDVMGNWVEGVVSNVFYQLSEPIYSSDNHTTLNGNADLRCCSNQWHTPPITHSGVAGVMRQVVMDTLQRQGQSVNERTLTDADLPKLSALFFCNAVRGIMPIARLQIGGRWHELKTNL